MLSHELRVATHKIMDKYNLQMKFSAGWEICSKQLASKITMRLMRMHNYLLQICTNYK